MRKLRLGGGKHKADSTQRDQNEVEGHGKLTMGLDSTYFWTRCTVNINDIYQRDRLFEKVCNGKRTMTNASNKGDKEPKQTESAQR